ncbi:MAG: aldo/keto reductase [Oscillospiraceae bacterium]|nr:aldo/keto reductase [Oscillospiraceae bacterium]
MSCLGKDIAKLGFGFMRLPTVGTTQEIDMDQVCKMVDLFLERGFTYFDTAYVYHGGQSEVALRRALVERHPRESFTVATKMPFFDMKDPAQVEEYFNTSKDRMGVEYFDFYLLHNLSEASISKAEEMGAWDFLRKKKEQGVIRHLGFSSHAKPEQIDDILTRHPEAEFIQLQINYMDWENEKIKSRECYEVARKHDKPIVIMEPIKGGFLASLTDEIRELFAATGSGNTPASLALRFCAELDGIITVLSGMSTLEQVEQNTAMMQNWKPLNDTEKKALDKAVKIIESHPRVPCTNCKYCMEVCPQEIKIPSIISILNDYEAYGQAEVIKKGYGMRVGPKGKASECVHCATCEQQCPQHIGISEVMEKAAGIFEG